MVQILRSSVAVALLGLSSSVEALKVTFKNACSIQIDLYSREGGATTADAVATIPVGGSTLREFGKDFEGHFRHGKDDSATLIEFSTKGTMNFVWYDISVIPAQLNKGFEFCSSLDECKANSKTKKGFNVPVQMSPASNINGNQCRVLTCLQDACPDAYLFPKDDTKTHACDLNTDFTVTFCPSGFISTTPAPSASTPTTTTVKPATNAPAATTAKPATTAPATQAPITPLPTTPAPTTVAPTVTPTAKPNVTMAPAPMPSSTPTSTSTPTQTPTQTPTPSPAPAPTATPAPTPTSTPDPSKNGKIQVPDVDKLVVVTSAPVSTTPAPTQAPTSAPKPTALPPPVVPAAIPAASKPKKKVIKHCV